MIELPERIVEAVEQSMLATPRDIYGDPVYGAMARGSAAAVLRELAEGGTGALWFQRFGTSMIQARDLRKLANEIEGVK